MKVSYRFFAELSAIKQAGFDLPNDSSVFIIQGDDERLDKINALSKKKFDYFSKLIGCGKINIKI